MEVIEKVESGEATDGDDKDRKLRYSVIDVDESTEDENDVIAAVEGEAPSTKDGLRRGDVQVSNLGEGCWDAVVSYDEPDDDNEYTFDTGGGTTHIAQSIATVNTYSNLAFPPDFENAIGVNGDNVDGTDITIPVFNFTETHRVVNDAVTNDYKQVVFALTGRVNDDTWKGFAAGEVLFLGASGSKKGTENWLITFKFAASKNATGLTVGAITGIAKKGWEYLWVAFEDAKDDDAKKLVKRPVAVYVEQVYEYGDFSLLGLE